MPDLGYSRAEGVFGLIPFGSQWLGEVVGGREMGWRRIMVKQGVRTELVFRKIAFIEQAVK